jgi:hypothetical protein
VHVDGQASLAGDAVCRAVDSRAHEDDHRRQPAVNSGGIIMNIRQTSKKPQVAIMNAIHDLPVLVARDSGSSGTRASTSTS